MCSLYVIDYYKIFWYHMRYELHGVEKVHD